MTSRNFVAAVLLTAALTGCDSMPSITIPSWVPFLGSKEEAVPKAPPGTPAVQPPDSVEAPAAQPAPEPPAPRVAVVEDEEYFPIDTGTVAPGMSREQVISLWGVPVAERTQAEWTYLYFKNGCERSCGTMDLVLLQNGQVVDAVVRAPGHTYAGESSSPPDRLPENTPPAARPAGEGP